jgi:putative DNA primase/helicase
MGDPTWLPSVSAFASYARLDVYAERFHHAGEWKYRPVARALNEDILARHLNGGPHVGVYLMEPESTSTRLAVLDFDDHTKTGSWDAMVDIAARVAEAGRAFGLEPWRVRSGGGSGLHLCYRWDAGQNAADVRKLLEVVLGSEGLENGSGGLARGHVEIFPKQDRVEEHGFGNLIAVPFGRESRPLDANFQDCPAPLMWLSSRPVQRAEMGRSEGASNEQEGAHDAQTIRDALAFLPNEDLDYETWIKIGMALKGALGDEGYAIFAEWSALSSKNNPNITDRKWRSFKPSKIGVGTIFYMAREKGWKGVPGQAPPFSDEAMALGFAEKHASTLRFTARWGYWHHWAGSHWEEDATLAIFDRARKFARDMAALANKKRSVVASAKTVAAITNLSRADRRFAMRTDQWDKDPWLLATPLGTMDLRHGTVRDSSPEDFITKVTTVAPGGDCPTWKTFLFQICDQDQSMVDYLQRIAGYCLTGSVREECIFFMHGEGGNGKGTFIETLLRLWGPFGVTVPMNTLVATRNQEHMTEIAKLSGARLAVASETQDGSRWNVARIKLLTGGDQLTGRFMRGNYFDFLPTHKLVVSGNRKPMLGTVDAAIKRRMHLIPFDIKVPVPDLTLKERLLQQEGGGILSWALEGCGVWQRHGLQMPPRVAKATEDYLHEQDDVQMWLEECTTRQRNAKTSASWLYGSWQQWCERNGGHAGSKKELGQRLEQKGFGRAILAGQIYYRDLAQGAVQGRADYPAGDQGAGMPDSDDAPF